MVHIDGNSYFGTSTIQTDRTSMYMRKQKSDSDLWLRSTALTDFNCFEDKVIPGEISFESSTMFEM